MPARSHRDLEVWQRAMDLVVESYAVSRALPRDELFGLTSQIRRASVSVPSNVAEGYGRIHRGDYVRHLSIAAGSLRELKTLLEITYRLGYLDKSALRGPVRLADRVGQMLHRLTQRLSKSGEADTRNPEPGTRKSSRAPRS